MTRRPACLILVAVLSTAGGGAAAADPVAEAPPAPEDVAFTVRVPGERSTFAKGEVIPLELVFTSTTPDRYRLDAATYDRGGRMALERFDVDPRDGAVDPLRSYFSAGPWMLGGLRSMPTLDREETVVEVTLNEWVRFDRPGSYRVVVTTHRVADLAAETTGERDVRSPPLVTLTAAPVELEIVAADPAWADRTLAEAVAALRAKDDETARRACACLRHLGTADAVDALVRHLADDASPCSSDAMLGLFGHPDPALAVRRLEEHLAGPGAVDGGLLHTLSRLAWLAEHPVRGEEDATARRDRFQAEREATAALSAHYLERLASALARKKGRALATSLVTLVENDALAPGAADDAGGARALLARHFHDLSPDRQVALLEHDWERLRGPAMVPVLRAIVDDPPAVSWVGGAQPRDLAVRRLFELDPDAARAIVLADVARPRPRLAVEVLGMLPDRHLDPALEASIVARLPSAGPGDGLGALSFLLARYGTRDVLPRVEKVYASERFAAFATCWRPPFLAYFLRVDPAAGAARLRAALTEAQPEEPPDCRASSLLETASILASIAPSTPLAPALEAIAVELLDARDPALARAAAELLREHAGPAAEAPLWRRLERWSARWRGREAELAADDPATVEERSLEWELYRAISQAAGWALGRDDLRRLIELSVSPTTRGQAEMRLAALGDDGEVPIHVFSLEAPLFQVGGYDARSLDALERRLAQFPPGTVFTCAPRGIGSEDQRRAFTERIEALLAAHGMGLVHR